MIIMKFGGTSVSKKEYIETIYAVAKREKKRQPVIVVSALSGVTDLLLQMVANPKAQKFLDQVKERHQSFARELWKDIIPDEVSADINSCIEEIKQAHTILNVKERSDAIVAKGEMMSSYIISRFFSDRGLPSEQVIATDLIVTTDDFGSAEFLPQPTTAKVKQNLIPLLKKGVLPVVTGFIGATKEGKVTTLGRSGSDYTASILGFALKAEEVQVWKDVDGVFTTDPRMVKTSYNLNKITYREASELAAFGAKVLHPRTIKPLMNACIPVRVLNTTQPSSTGTLIECQKKVRPRITAIASKKNITLLNLYSTEMLLQKGFLARIFAVFAKHEISIDLVSVSEVSVSVTLDNDEHLGEAMRDLSEFNTVTKLQRQGIVSIIGEHIVNVPHVMESIFSSLSKHNIQTKMISFGATDINISLVIESSQVVEAITVLHTHLLEKGVPK